MSRRHPTSLRRIALHNVLVTLLVILLAAVFAGGTFLQVLQHREYDLARQLAGNHARLIAQHIEIYRRIVQNLAGTRAVRDLVLIGDAEAAQRWASEHRLLLPDAVGLALIDSDGNLLGNPPAQRVGRSCLIDLDRALAEGTGFDLPTHFEVRGLEHYDLIVPITDDNGERIGLLFSSFRLTTLQTLIDGLTRDGSALELRNGEGRILAARNNLSEGDETLDFTLLISGTGWKLHMRIARHDLRPVLFTVGMAALFTFVFVTLLTLALQLRLTHAVSTDYQAVLQALERLHHDETLPVREAAPPGYHLQETRKLLERLFQTIEDIRLHQQELTGLGLTDELTGMPNRRHFNRRLHQYRELANAGTPVALVLLDLDDFKLVNDRHGHDYGDEVLRRFAGVLREHLRETDFAARLGGDEFVCVLLDIERPWLAQWFERLHRHWLQTEADALPELADHPVTVSAGFAFLDPARDREPGHALRRADIALYQSKQAGKGRVSGN